MAAAQVAQAQVAQAQVSAVPVPLACPPASTLVAALPSDQSVPVSASVVCAASADGRWLAVATPGAAASAPPMLWVLDAQRAVQRQQPVATLHREPAAGVQGVWTLAARRSWLLAPVGLKELWEVSYDPAAELIFDGLVHDYRMAEAVATPGFLGARRVPLTQPMTVVGVEPDGHRVWLVPTRTDTADQVGNMESGPVTVEVLHLANRRTVATVQVSGPVAPGAGRVVTLAGQPHRVLPAASGNGAWTVRLGSPLGTAQWWPEGAPTDGLNGTPKEVSGDDKNHSKPWRQSNGEA